VPSKTEKQYSSPTHTKKVHLNTPTNREQILQKKRGKGDTLERSQKREDNMMDRLSNNVLSN
jgi:hypothetical protein